jgi:hypothetical protein
MSIKIRCNFVAALPEIGMKLACKSGENAKKTTFREGSGQV